MVISHGRILFSRIPGNNDRKAFFVFRPDPIQDSLTETFAIEIPDPKIIHKKNTKKK